MTTCSGVRNVGEAILNFFPWNTPNFVFLRWGTLNGADVANVPSEAQGIQSARCVWYVLQRTAGIQPGKA